MRRYLLPGLLCPSVAAHAAASPRVDDKVLTIGDTAARAQELLGMSTVPTCLHRQDGGLPDGQVAPGEQWQYSQQARTPIITIVHGKVTDFQMQYHRADRARGCNPALYSGPHSRIRRHQGKAPYGREHAMAWYGQATASRESRGRPPE